MKPKSGTLVSHPKKGDRDDKRCAFARSHHCTRDVRPRDWCYGCGFYVCEAHAQESASGVHDVIEHLPLFSDD